MGVGRRKTEVKEENEIESLVEKPEGFNLNSRKSNLRRKCRKKGTQRVQNNKCKLYRINGMPDHIHIFTDLHPTVCLSDLVKDIKVASNLWMKKSGLFPEFEEWQESYSAFTYSVREKDMIINYIKNQKEHHKTESFEQEIKRLLKENEIEFDEKYLL